MKIPSFASMLVAAVVATTIAVSPGDARAQSPEAVAATRHALLQQADAAARAGNHAEAVDLAERAGRIAMTPSLRYFLAREQRLVGRIADALGNAQLCIQLAERDANVPMRADILSECRTMVSELEPRVAHVTVNVPSPPPAGLQVRVNGVILPDAVYGAPYVVNPGETVIEATAPGHASFRTAITLAPGATQSATVAVPAVEGSSAPPPMPLASSSPPPATSPMPAAMTAARPRSNVPWVLIGGGVVFAAIGVVLAAAVYAPAVGDLNNQCGTPHVCVDVPRVHNDVTLGNIGSIGGIASGVVALGLFASGITWAILDRMPHVYRAMPLASRFGVAPANGGAMLTFGGSL